MNKENPVAPIKMPDRFVLDKKDVKFVLKSVKKFWNRDEMSSLQNASYVSIMSTIQGMIDTPLVNIVTMKNVYFSVQECARQLETLNSLKISVLDELDRDEPNQKIIDQLQGMVEIQYKKLGSGKAFEN